MTKNKCDVCNGECYVVEYHTMADCCGNFNEYGLCCGNAIPVQVPEQMPCPRCHGEGEIIINTSHINSNDGKGK